MRPGSQGLAPGKCPLCVSRGPGGANRALPLTFQKQALLEKKMAYHLQKIQQNGLRREDLGKNTSDFRGQEAVRPECKSRQGRGGAGSRAPWAREETRL